MLGPIFSEGKNMGSPRTSSDVFSQCWLISMLGRISEEGKDEVPPRTSVSGLRDGTGRGRLGSMATIGVRSSDADARCLGTGTSSMERAEWTDDGFRGNCSTSPCLARRRRRRFRIGGKTLSSSGMITRRRRDKKGMCQMYVRRLDLRRGNGVVMRRD
jgi:hypothetical protein